jgi:hypothetical protein
MSDENIKKFWIVCNNQSLLPPKEQKWARVFLDSIKNYIWKWKGQNTPTLSTKQMGVINKYYTIIYPQLIKRLL